MDRTERLGFEKRMSKLNCDLDETHLGVDIYNIYIHAYIIHYLEKSLRCAYFLISF